MFTTTPDKEIRKLCLFYKKVKFLNLPDKTLRFIGFTTISPAADGESPWWRKSLPGSP